MSVWKFVLRRLLLSIPVIIGVLALTFFLTDLMPGDPIARMLGEHVTPEKYIETSRRYGFDQPITIRFLIYMKNLFTGDWGTTFVISKGTSVWDVIMLRFPRTIELAIFAMSFSSILGIISGVISSTHRNKGRDTVIRGLSLVGVSMPVFWLGLLMQLLFAYLMNIFPATNYKSIYLPEPPTITTLPILDSLLSGNIDLFWDRVHHIIMPGVTLGLIYVASVTRQTRSSMLEVLEQDYIRTARAKGCKERTVTYRHALRNAMIPTSTVIGLGFASLMGGAVLTESVYNYKGMGQLLVSAIEQNEYFLLNALVFLITMIFIVSNIVTDVIYSILDPRIRLK